VGERWKRDGKREHRADRWRERESIESRKAGEGRERVKHK
jgi:hypothetical protein